MENHEVTADAEAGEEPTEEVTPEAEAATYEIPTELDESWDELRTNRPAAKLAGGWSAEAQEGVLDPEQPRVQELAYNLLVSGLTTPQAMMGAKGRTPTDDRKAKVSLGGDGRWFANPADVVAAAKAHAKSLSIKTADLPWVVRRPGKVA